MSLQNCLTSLRQYIQKEGIPLTEPEVRSVAKKMDDQFKADPSRAGLISTMDEIVQKQMSEWATQRRVAKLLDIAKSEAVVAKYKTNKQVGISAYEHLRNTIEGGGLKPGFETNLDPLRIEDFMRSKFTKMLGELHDLEDVYQRGGLDRQVFQEMDALQSGRKIGESGSKEAGTIATVIHNLNEYVSARKKALNPMFDKAEGYFTRRTHDPVKVLGDGTEQTKAAWVDFMMTHASRSFEGLSSLERQDRFRAVYDDIVTENYGRGASGAGDIRARMAQSRTLLFNDWQAEYLYNQTYGSANLANSVLRSVGIDARQIARLEKFGSSPKEWFERTYNRVFDAASPVEKKQLKSKRLYLEKSMRTALSEINAPANGTWAKAVQGSMKMANWTTTGGSILSTAPDFAISVQTIADSTGRNTGEIARDLVGYELKNLKPSEAKIYLDALDLYTSSYNQMLARDLGIQATPNSGVKGAISKGVQFMDQNWHKITLMEYRNNAQRSAAGALVSNILAQDSGLAFKDLPIQGQKGRLRYGIGPNEWDVIRKATDDIKGRQHVTPGAIDGLPDAEIEKYLRKTGELTGEKLAPKTPTFQTTTGDLFSVKKSSKPYVGPGFGETKWGDTFLKDKTAKYWEVKDQSGDVIGRALTSIGEDKAPVIQLVEISPQWRGKGVGDALYSQIDQSYKGKLKMSPSVSEGAARLTKRLFPDKYQQGVAEHLPGGSQYLSDAGARQGYLGVLEKGSPTFIADVRSALEGNTLPKSEGYSRISLEPIKEMPPAKEILDQARVSLQVKLAAMINEHAQIGSVMGGTRQRTFIFKGEDINSGVGQAARVIGQLKQASLVSNDAIRRSWYSGEGLRGNLSGVATMASGMVLMSAMGYYAKSTLEGKTPEDPRSVRFAAEVLARAGVGGITADIMGNAVYKQGLDQKMLAMLEGLGGPVGSKLVEGTALGMQSIQAALTNKKQPSGAQARFLMSNLPIQGQLQNLVYTRGLWNWYFTNGVKELINPGYIGNTVRNTQKNGQEFMFFDPRESPRF